VTHRGWCVALALGVNAAACGHGTSGWVLSEATDASGGAGGVADEDSGSLGTAAGAPDSAAGALGEAGMAGAAGEPGVRLRCPTRFASVCAPTVVFDNRDTTASGQLFAQAIPDLATTLPCITRDVCDMLYRKTSEIKNITQITVITEAYDGISETYGSGTEATIHMSTLHMQQVTDAGGNLGDELRGIFYYHGTNIYQFDDGDGTANAWLVEGVADFVRHSAGYLPDSQRMAGGKYNDGFETTGFFFVWLNASYTDFVYSLNASLNPNDMITWTPQAFNDITGKSVDDLWAAYQASF
jgi:hypothetical protein